jgi:hypothetical protein
MLYQNRDRDINYIKTRKDHCCYGMGLGIMVLDDAYPGFPGDVRNASAFPFPVQYEIAEGVNNYTLVWEEDKSPCLPPIQRAAKKLEKMGCRAIAAECGYFAYFQKDVAGYVDVPVFMSSLLQVPFIQQIIQNVGIDLNSNFVIAGSQDEYGLPEFDNLWDHSKRPECPEVYYDKAENDMVRISREFIRAHTGIGALMLECTGMQPFARAIQREIDLPVFSWGTLLDYAYSVVVHRDYYGHI